MDMLDHQPHYAALTGPETPNQAAVRIAHEREVIERAEADVAAGRVIEWGVMRAWLDELEHNPDAPPPEPQEPAPARV
jgi:hypothetical protein